MEEEINYGMCAECDELNYLEEDGMCGICSATQDMTPEEARQWYKENVEDIQLEQYMEVERVN